MNAPSQGMENCLVCFNSYSIEHNSKLCSGLPPEASQKLFNSCARHLYSDIVDDNFVWDSTSTPLLPFCWECFHFATKLSRLNNKLEAIEKEVIQLVDNYTIIILNSRKNNLSAKKARDEAKGRLENVSTSKVQYDFQMSSRSNFLSNMRSEQLRAIQNRRRPIRLFPLRTPKVVVDKLKKGTDGNWVTPKPKPGAAPTIIRRHFIKARPRIKFPPRKEDDPIEVIDLSPPPSPMKEVKVNEEHKSDVDQPIDLDKDDPVKEEEKGPPSPFFPSEDPLKCAFCEETFANAEAKSRHKICHSIKFVPQLCDLCGKVCADYRRLQVHHKQHLEEGLTFKCEICDKVFSRPQGLKQHMFIHSEETPFPCDQCGKGFRTKPNLKIHLKVHKVDEETPFKCPTCAYTYNTLERLNNHQKRCNPIKEKLRFKCDDCVNYFANRRTLLLHLFLKHNKGQMFNCDWENCVKSFVSSAALKAHKKRYHSVHSPSEPTHSDSCTDDSSSEYHANFQSLDLSMQNSHLQLINHQEPQQQIQQHIQQQQVENTQAHRLENTQAHRLENSQTHRLENTQTHRLENTQSHRLENAQTHRLENTQSHRHSHSHDTLNIPQLPLANYRPPVIQQPVTEYRQQIKSLAPVDYRTTTTTSTSTQQIQSPGYTQHFQPSGYSQHFQVQPGFSQHFQPPSFSQHFQPTTSTSTSGTSSQVQVPDYRHDNSGGSSGGGPSSSVQSSRQNFPIQNSNYYQKLQLKGFPPVEAQAVPLPTNSLQALQFQTKELQQQVQAALPTFYNTDYGQMQGLQLPLTYYAPGFKLEESKEYKLL